MPLNERILALSDPNALAALQRFSSSQIPTNVPQTIDTTLAQQIRDEAGLPSVATPSVSQGDIARAALQLLAADPAHREGIQYLLDNADGARFNAVEWAGLASAVLIVLQTHVRFERDKHGDWSFKIEKKPTNASLLKDLLQKLAAYKW